MTFTSAQLDKALERVPSLDRQGLLTMRANAERYGDAAQTLIAAINERLGQMDQSGGIAAHRLEFAREMLRKMDREPVGRSVASIDLFKRAVAENADNPYVAWMQGNSARAIPLTKALEEVRPEFPHLVWRKEGDHQGARVFYTRTR